MAKVQDGYFVI